MTVGSPRPALEPDMKRLPPCIMGKPLYVGLGLFQPELCRHAAFRKPLSVFEPLKLDVNRPAALEAK